MTTEPVERRMPEGLGDLPQVGRIGPTLDRKTFERFREVVYARSGINLRDGKESLVAARVGKRMRSLGLNCYREYLNAVMEDESGDEVVQLLDAISTNVTSFFREPGHFDFLRERLTEWADAGQRRFRLWSAACSSGEEPYSIAMTMLEALAGYGGIDAKILATDISTKVLARCSAGEYHEDKVKGVPPPQLGRYFDRRRESGENVYVVRQELKRPIVFKRLNLSAPPFPMQGPMDVIFCRNVMIYFDNGVRRKLLAEHFRLLKPGGFLMVGHAESLTGMVSEFKTVRPSIYVKP